MTNNTDKLPLSILAFCILPCLHRGHCISPYLCACPPDYTGSRCQKCKYLVIMTGLNINLSIHPIVY